MQEAKVAKEKMHGKLACGRPLVVRLASEKYLIDAASNSSKASGETSKSSSGGSCPGQMSRSAKIAAIKNKLKTMEEEGRSSKKQKPDEIPSPSDSTDWDLIMKTVISTNIILETDSETLFLALMKRSFCIPIEISSIVEDIHSYDQSIQQLSVTQVRRSGNKAVDWIVKQARRGNP